MKWYKHDTNAHADAKLKKVRMKYGLEGYGMYWYCLELIAASVDVDNLTFELEHDAEIISHDTGIHYERVNEMMTYMVDLGLFENDNGAVTCLKLAKRLDKSMTSNPRMRELIEKVKKNHDPVMTKPDGIMQDKIRLDKNRLDNNNSSVPPAGGTCEMCCGTGIEIGFDSASGGPIQYNCSQCTGQEPQPPAKPEKPKRKTKAEKLFDKLRLSGYLIAQASDDVLTEWCKLRAKKCASDSDLVHKRIDGQLQILINHGMTIDAALTEQVARNWTDLKAEWFDVMKGRLPNQQQWEQQTQSGWSAGCESELHRGDK